jgi:hypothetical protein
MTRDPYSDPPPPQPSPQRRRIRDVFRQLALGIGVAFVSVYVLKSLGVEIDELDTLIFCVVGIAVVVILMMPWRPRRVWRDR